MTSAAQKENLRRLVRAAGRKISPAERADASRRLAARLLDLPLWKQAGTILLYLPFPSEPDIRPLFSSAWQQGKTTCLLRFVPDRDAFEACQVRDLETDLEVEGPFGQPEPAPHCRVHPANQLDLLLVPGVGFSMSGCRLGRGRGYYDRFLAQASGIALGLAFDWQVTPDVPSEPHDIRVHCLLTPTRWQEVTDRRRL